MTALRAKQRGFLINAFRFLAGGGGGDPSFASVVALLHFDGTDGSTTITDVKGKTWTVSGTAAIDTGESKFGGASLEDPTSASKISTASHADFGYGTGDFTIEFWLRLLSTGGGVRGVYDQRTATSQAVPCLYMSNTDMAYFVGGLNRITSTGWTTGTWYHVAVSRVSGTTRLFRDGTQVGSSYTDATNYITSPVVLGDVNDTPNQGAIGWFDDLRITNGVGRYASNFTAPAAAFPDS